MTPRARTIAGFVVFFLVVVFLIALFPPVMEFAEMAARELRYLWWLVLLVALAIWLIWGFRKKT